VFIVSIIVTVTSCSFYIKCLMCPPCCWTTPLTNGVIDETLQQFAPLSDDHLFQLVDCCESSVLIDHFLKIHILPGTHWRTCGVRTSRLSNPSWHVASKQPGVKSSRLRCLGCPCHFTR